MNKNYKWDAKHYHENSINQARWARSTMEKLNLKGSERILDIGCGDGKLTAELAQLVPQGHVVGVDVSLEMIQFAKEMFEKSSSNISFQQANASLLPFNNEFDLIVSFTCLHWVKDHSEVLKGIKRSLKPSGTVFLQFGGRGTLDAILELTAPVFSMEPWKTHFNGFVFPWYFYTDKEYAPWVKEAGLNPKRVELLPYEGSFNFEGLKGWIRSSWIPYLEHLPENKRELFIEAVAVQYFKDHSPDVDGNIQLNFQRLEVEAVNQ